MNSDGKGVRCGPFCMRTVHGEPYYIHGRKLTPVTRILSCGKARGTVGSKGISGWGGGFAWIVPVAVMEETASGERRIAIRDAAAATLGSLYGAAVAITLFFVAVRCLVRRRRKSRPE